MQESISIGIPSGSSAESPKLVVRFAKQADRWSHDWWLVDQAGNETKVLSSVEGSSEDDFPPSAPLQEVDLHELPAGAAALAVGMAGKGHWSASFSVESRDGQPVVKCDSACFLKEQGSGQPWLGATYLLSDDAVAEETNAGVCIRLNDLVVEIVPDSELAVAKLDQGLLKIEPAKWSDDKGAATRWLFECSLGSQAAF